VALWLAVTRMPLGVPLACAAGVAAAVALLVGRALTRPAGPGAHSLSPWASLAAVVAGAAGGLGGGAAGSALVGGLGLIGGGLPWWAAGLCGLATGLVAVFLTPALGLAHRRPPSLADLAVVTLPLAIGAIPVWVASLALG
jgi:hypothetical protein